MRLSLLSSLVLASLLVSGCARSSLDSRKQERFGAYSGLAEESKQLVDEGKIKVGMTEDAVYIAWGEPTEILHAESEKGASTTWLYEGTYLEQYRYWRDDPVYPGRRYSYSSPSLAYDYLPRTYVTAKVEFRDGKVTHWQTLPRPHR